MKSDSRNIKYFDLQLSCTFRVSRESFGTVAARPLLDLLQELQRELKRGGEFNVSAGYGNQLFTLEKIDVTADRTKAMMLVSRSDRLAANQAISDPKKRRFAKYKKQDGEGNAYSCHVAMNLARSPNGYLCLVEESTGISGAHVLRLVRGLIRRAKLGKSSFFLIKDPSGAVNGSGQPIVKKLNYLLRLDGHPSASFAKELNEGVLEGLQVIDEKNADNVWDDEKLTTEKARVIHLKPKPTSRERAYSVVQSVCATAHKNKFEAVRVKFTDSKQFKRSVILEAAQMRLVNEDRFVRKERITNFSEPLDTAYQDIHSEIRDKMFYLL